MFLKHVITISYFDIKKKNDQPALELSFNKIVDLDVWISPKSVINGKINKNIHLTSH